MTNPWDAERLTPHDLDQCACGHSRDVHNESRCWACYVITPRIAAPAYPDHAFHMAWPWVVPVQTSRDVLGYVAPPGWDRPKTASQS